MKAKFIYESLGDVLKPKSEEDIDNLLSKYNIDKHLSLRIRKPTIQGFTELYLKRAVNITNVKVSEYPITAPVPDEENHSDFLKVSGPIWDIYKFFILYYGFSDKPIEQNLERIKRIQINETLNESSIYKINKEDVTKDLCKELCHGNEVFMYSYAYEHGLNPEDMDLGEWEDTEEGKEWIEYEIDSLFWETLNKFKHEVINDDGTIPIWRKMRVSKNWLEHLSKQGKRLGIYWSYEPDAAEEHWGYDMTKDSALIQSSVKEEHVNWIDTISVNMDETLSEEKEIRLFKNTPIRIDKIWINDEEVNIDHFKNKIFKA